MSLETDFFVRSEKSNVFTDIFVNKRQQSGLNHQPEPQKTISAEIEIIAEQSYLRGKQDGLHQATEAATKEAKKHFDTEILKIQKHVTQVERGFAALEKNIVNDVVKLSIAIAEKITLTHLTLNSVAVLPIIHKAIDMLPSFSTSYQIRLNPIDAQCVEKYLRTHYKDKKISLTADDTIQIGGAIVSTDTSQVDATNEQRWNQIANDLDAQRQWINNS